MSNDLIKIAENFDLDSNIFDQVAQEFSYAASGESNLDFEFVDPRSFELSTDGTIELYLFFERQLQLKLNQMTSVETRLQEILDELNAKQLKSRVTNIYMIDCSERPNALLSDLGHLGGLTETVSSLFGGSTEGAIFTLDYELDHAGLVSGVEVFDTRDEAFSSRAIDFFLNNIKNLNTKFGMTAQVDLLGGQEERDIESTLEKMLLEAGKDISTKDIL